MSRRTGQEEHDFMNWLDNLVQEDPSAIAAESEESLKIRLADALRAARSAVGMPQTLVSEVSGLKQSVVSRLEKADHNPTLETIRRYLDAIGADLVLSVIVSGQSHHATEAAERTVTLPVSIVCEAKERGLTLREYVFSCLEAGRALEELRESLHEAVSTEIARQFHALAAGELKRQPASGTGA